MLVLLSGLADAFNKDTDPKKVSLGVGAYRGDDGKPAVLNAVRKAEKIVLEKALNHEYAGIAGGPHPSKQPPSPHRTAPHHTVVRKTLEGTKLRPLICRDACYRSRFYTCTLVFALWRIGKNEAEAHHALT